MSDLHFRFPDVSLRVARRPIWNNVPSASPRPFGVTCPTLETVPDCYNVITEYELLDHYYDIPAFLDVYRRKLRKDGGIVLLTGDISSLGAHLAGP